MTMQVGMVGSDGVLLASDTRWTYTPRLRPNELWAGGRYTSSTEKIIISHERQMAITCARNMEVARELAKEIISGISEEECTAPIASLETIGAKVLSSCEEKRNDAQCLIAFMYPVPQLFLLQYGTVNARYGAVGQRMHEYGFAGDNFNPSLFWVERYYKRKSPRPIEQLVPLAAHFIISSAKLSTMISGLEIVLCRPSGILRLSDVSTRELEEQANRWDEEFGNTLFNHTQQFTYAPNVVG
jgi:hypothetical protein